MLLRFATSLAAFSSSGSSAERNLLAQRSMGPSMVASTVSLALEERLSMLGGILMSCVMAVDARSGRSQRIVFILVASFIFNRCMDLLLHLPGLVLIHVHLVDFRFGQLQFAAGDAKGQHQPLLGGFTLGTLAAHGVDVNSENHGGGDRRQRGPAADWLSEEA